VSSRRPVVTRPQRHDDRRGGLTVRPACESPWAGGARTRATGALHFAHYNPVCVHKTHLRHFPSGFVALIRGHEDQKGRLIFPELPFRRDTPKSSQASGQRACCRQASPSAIERQAF
jgi:hypothetical protein